MDPTNSACIFRYVVNGTMAAIIISQDDSSGTNSGEYYTMKEKQLKLVTAVTKHGGLAWFMVVKKDKPAIDNSTHSVVISLMFL